MTKAKRKKAEKGYSYYEYVKKFKPKSLPKQEERPNKEALHCLSRLVLDRTAPEGNESPAHLKHRK